MSYRQILFNSVTISMPKNIIQFSLGVAMFWLAFGTVNPLLAVVGLAAFLLTYSSVYMYNDIIDRHEDKKHKEKMKWKLVASGELSVESAMGIYIILLVSGLFFSLFVNRWFSMLLVLLVALNFLHSSTFTKFKKSKPKTAVNMTLIQFIKYSCGWFALTTNISAFPFWIVLAFAAAYTLSYLIYKIDFKGHVIRQQKVVLASLAVVGVFAYALSFVLYSFPLALMIMFFSITLLLLAIKSGNFKFNKMSDTLFTEYIILPVVILSFIALTNPVVAGVNSYVVDNVNTYKESVTESLPQDVRTSFENLLSALSRYENLEELENEINMTFAEALNRSGGS